MTQARKVAVIVGSLRRDSTNRKIAQALSALAPAGLELEIVEIADLPLYNEDLEGGDAPAAWTRFREQVRAADAVLFVTPEYTARFPAASRTRSTSARGLTGPRCGAASRPRS